MAEHQERTERATPKRLEEARRKGQVPRSRELATALMLLAAAGMLLVGGPQLGRELAALMEAGLRGDPAALADPTALLAHLGQAVGRGFLAVAPLLGLLALAAVVGTVAVGGFNYSAQALQPRWSKLDPIKGLQRILSWRGLVELGKALLKLALVAWVTWWVLQWEASALLALGNLPTGAALAEAGRLLAWAFLALSASLLLVAVVDVPYQLWSHQRQLRMTRQEVKEEHKQTEGSPEVRARIRRLQMEQAQRRMMAEVPKADVVITNPTHYAVALRYDERRMAAPVVVAKGTDLVALHIRRIAREHGVPQVHSPVLARALYYSTELERPIPVGLYRAVAQVLAYVWQLRAAGGEVEEVELPDVPVPEELRR